MATTPNYALPVPPDSTYVADLAQIVREQSTIVDEVLDQQETRVLNAEQSAKDASLLVGAPAGDAIKAAISPGGAAQPTMSNAIEQAVSPVRNTITKSSDPLAYLDNVKLFAKFPVRENGETSWIQGFAINKGEKHYYVSNQKGTELRIDRRNIGDNVRGTSRKITVENNAYTESLDWFRNDAGDLCFIVWPKALAFPSAYAIYNLSRGTLGPQIPINGLVRGSRYGDIFVTTDTWGTNAPSAFYVYKWSSIIAGSPELLSTINCKNYSKTVAKTQGIAYNDGYIFFAQGDQDENMTITVYNTRGEIHTVKSYDRASLMTAVNTLVPGLLTNPDYLYECEGAYHLDGKLYTLQIVNNNPSVASDAVALILEHNNLDGLKINSYVSPASTVGDWINIKLMAGWTHHPDYPFQARVNGEHVEFRGYALNPTFTGGYTKFADLPESIPAPKSAPTFAVPGPTAASRSIVIYAGGGLEVFTSSASEAWYGISGQNYSIGE